MSDKRWTFITNHAAVLTLLAREDNLTARKIASELNITPRTVFRIIQDLEEGGYITVSKQGRENRYASIPSHASGKPAGYPGSGSAGSDNQITHTG